MVEFEKYAAIKDFYCICYFGPNDEYLVQLRLLKSCIEKHFSGIRIFIGCRDDKTQIAKCDDVLSLSELKEKRLDFGHIRELTFKGKSHPIEDFLLESGISNFVIQDELQETYTQKCIILSEGMYPTASLDAKTIDKLKKSAENQGFYVDESGDASNVGLVIGVECPQIYEAAAQGVRTWLCPTGIGTKLFQKMFPKAEVLNF